MTSPFEEGSPRSKIAFVAEAPSNVEMKMGRPMVGPSGMLFNDCLREAGIARADCYLTNVWEERVFKNEKTGEFFDPAGECLYRPRTGFTELGRQKANNCIERLEHFKGNVICPMGGVATELLFGDKRVTKWRGSILSSSDLGGRKIVPTFHPTFVLRGNQIHQYTIVHDFKRVREESATPKIILLDRDLRINPVFPEVVAFLKMARKKKRIATDIECLNRHVSCFSVAVSPKLAMSIPLLDERQNHRWTEEQETIIWSLYADIMGDPSIMKINQNIIFDICFLFQQNHIITRGPLGDTMVAHHILYPEFPKGLDFICSNYTREPYYKDDGKLWSKPWKDMERFWLYNCKDSAVAFEAWDGQLEEELKDGFEWTYNRTIELFDPLTYMMVHGIRLNVERLNEQKKEAKARLEEKQKELDSIADVPFNPMSPKQCQNYFYVIKGIKPYISTHTGGVTTDDKAMARIVKRYGLKEARLVQEIRGLNKLISNYLEVRYDEDERVRCSYNPRGTTTGRLSSSETIFGTGLNLQNLDTEFKDFMEADPA